MLLSGRMLFLIVMGPTHYSWTLQIPGGKWKADLFSAVRASLLPSSSSRALSSKAPELSKDCTRQFLEYRWLVKNWCDHFMYLSSAGFNIENTKDCKLVDCGVAHFYVDPGTLAEGHK